MVSLLTAMTEPCHLKLSTRSKHDAYIPVGISGGMGGLAGVVVGRAGGLGGERGLGGRASVDSTLSCTLTTSMF